MRRLEGPGYVPDDNGHGPSHWGIVGSNHGLSPAEVRALSPERAAAIYKRDYWDAIDADDLPANVQLAAFNAAVQFGPQRAETMIANAGGDPDMLLRETGNFEYGLAARKPWRYGHSLRIWRKRQAILADYIHNSSSVDEPLADRPGFQLASFDMGSGPGPFHPHRHSHRSDAYTQAQADQSQTVAVEDATPPGAAADHFAPPPSATPSVSPQIPNPSHPWLKMLASLFLAPFLWMSGLRRRAQKAGEDFGSFGPVPHESPGGASNGNASRSAEAFSYFAQDGHFAQNWPDLTDSEYEAFYHVYWRHSPARHESGWKVDYADGAQAMIEKGNVTVRGENAIEDSLLYASKAWGECELTGGTPEFREKIRAAAQKLVDEGKIASGFIVEGLGTFHQTPPQPQPDRPSAGEGIFRRRAGPRYAFAATSPA